MNNSKPQSDEAGAAPPAAGPAAGPDAGPDTGPGTGTDAQAAGPALQLSSFLPYQLSVVAEQVSRLFADRYEKRFDLGIPEWRVLAVIGEAGEQSTQQVIERTRMDRVRVSRAAIRLSDKGLIRRIANPRDQRAQILDLTPAGRAVYAQIVPLANSLQAALAEALSAAERQQLEAILAKLGSCAERLAYTEDQVEPG